MTEGILKLNFANVPDLALDYANGEWAKLRDQIRSAPEPNDGLFRSIVESVRDALAAETSARVAAKVAAEAQELDSLTAGDFDVQDEGG